MKFFRTSTDSLLGSGKVSLYGKQSLAHCTLWRKVYLEFRTRRAMGLEELNYSSLEGVRFGRKKASASASNPSIQGQQILRAFYFNTIL
jgi:hypothetical protein